MPVHGYSLVMERSEAISPLSEAQGNVIGQVGIGALSLFVANASLLFLYIVYDLTLFQLVIVLWLECFWVGFFSVLKMITASMLGDPYQNRHVEMSGGVNLIISFFAIGLVGGQFLGLFGLTGISIAFVFDAVTDGGAEGMLFDSIGLILGSTAMFFIGHGISFIANFLMLGEYKTAKVSTLLGLPFRRCFALLGSISIAICVMYLVPVFSSTAGFAALLMLFKVLWDFRLHMKERKAFAI